MTYRVLSLDGGGIRGLITAILMQRLSQQDGLQNWLAQVDLIAGASTGGLLALAIARGLDLQVIRDLYEQKGAEVFDDSWLDDVVDLGALIGAQYDIKNLGRELRRILGSTTLGELSKQVLIAAFDLDNEASDPTQRCWKPKLFHNIPGADNDDSWLAYEVGLYTAAAPTYFPTVDGFIDGGVYANNPSMCALAQTQDCRNTLRPPLGEVALFSLGTGISLTYIKGKALNWGYAQWARPLVSLMLDGVNGIADYQCKQILGKHYHRLAPVFPPGTAMEMDEVKRIPEMIEFARRVPLTAAADWLRQYWV